MAAVDIQFAVNRTEVVAYCAGRDDKISGYCLGRSGSECEQIGPILAEDTGTAKALLLLALRHCARTNVIVDTPMEHKGWMQFLFELGFVERRPFIRMCLGHLEYPGKSDRQFGIAGPEVG